jgi:uncharacterized membrane protein/thiol-disulfide isomerase/thioredoxin
MANLFVFVMLLLSLLSPGSASLQSEESIVRAVLFYSPSCGHCHYVIQEVLPPLFEKYGDRLQIIGIDISQPDAGDLYVAALKKFNRDRGGVPALVVGDQLMIGSVDIPEKFPALIEQYLAQGGVDWPDIPGLAEVLSAVQSTQATATAPMSNQPSPGANPTDSPDEIIPVATPLIAITPTPTAVNLLLTSNTDTGVWERLARDPWGNTLAIIVLAGMLVSLIGLWLYLPRNHRWIQAHTLDWLIPVLCIVGLGVAGYMAYVETTHVSAVCGPVGDCNTVQQSEYAVLFGILPIGVLGLLGYSTMGIIWVISRIGKEKVANLAALMLFLMSLFGVMFSIYLTYLEPFVIGASCAWCLTSAILMTGLMWLTARRGISAWFQLQGKALPRHSH